MIKEDVMSLVFFFFEEFHMTGTFERILNASFIVFIFKKPRDFSLKSSNPWPWWGSLYRILAKVVVNKLRQEVGILVLQNAFVEERQVLNFY